VNSRARDVDEMKSVNKKKMRLEIHLFTKGIKGDNVCLQRYLYLIQPPGLI